MLFLRWLFGATDLRGPLSVYVNPLLAVNPSRSHCNVFAEIQNSQWFDVSKFALREAISHYVLVDLLSVYGVSRASVLAAHQTISFWLGDHTCFKLCLQEGPSLPWLQRDSGQQAKPRGGILNLCLWSQWALLMCVCIKPFSHYYTHSTDPSDIPIIFPHASTPVVLPLSHRM